MPRTQQSRRARWGDWIARTIRKPDGAKAAEGRRAAALIERETPGSPRTRSRRTGRRDDRIRVVWRDRCAIGARPSATFATKECSPLATQLNSLAPARRCCSFLARAGGSRCDNDESSPNRRCPTLAYAPPRRRRRSCRRGCARIPLASDPLRPLPLWSRSAEAPAGHRRRRPRGRTVMGGKRNLGYPTTTGQAIVFASHSSRAILLQTQTTADPGRSGFGHDPAAGSAFAVGAAKRRDPSARPVRGALRRLPLPVVLDRLFRSRRKARLTLPLVAGNIARGGSGIWRERRSVAAHFQPRAKEQPIAARLLEVSLNSRPSARAKMAYLQGVIRASGKVMAGLARRLD